MNRSQKFASGVVGLVIAYAAGLLMAGDYAQKEVRAKLTEKLQASLGASSQVGTVDVGLIRGVVEIDNLQARRDDGGHLRLTVKHARASIAPGGLALLKRDVGDLRIDGVELEMSAQAVARTNSEPITADRVLLQNVVVRLMPTAWAPELGSLKITVRHAESGHVRMATAVSWLFALQNLDASVDVAGVTVTLTKQGDTLMAAGSVFGATPVPLPFKLVAGSPETEVDAVIDFGKRLGAEVILRKAKSLLP